MKIAIDLEDNAVRNKLAAVLGGWGHQIVSSPAEANVVVVDLREKAWDLYRYDARVQYAKKIVIQFVVNPLTEAAYELQHLCRLYVCHSTDDLTYGGIGGVLAAVAKIANRQK